MKPERSFVLVVDDNEANRDVLARRLKRQGHAVAMAKNGRQALEMMRAQEFDLVLLDIMMLEMNGYQVLEHLKADPTLCHIPVIVISALDDLGSVVKCIELGAEDYLLKPFNPVLLKARVGASLEKKRLRDQEQAYLQAVKREMELAWQIQSDFLPDELLQPPGWEIAVSFHPALEVAGDFYDTFPLPGNRVGLVIADVSGKGVGAALFMALIRSLIRVFAEQAASITADVLNAVPLINNYITLHHQHRKRMFATLFFGVLDTATGALTYVNAGHHPPVLVGPAGVKASLEPTGPAVGIMPDAEFALGQAHFEPGDTLVAYTDGVTEAFNPGGEFFTAERLLSTLEQPISSAAAVLERIEASVRVHIAQGTPSDDVTMLAVRRI